MSFEEKNKKNNKIKILLLLFLVFIIILLICFNKNNFNFFGKINEHISGYSNYAYNGRCNNLKLLNVGNKFKF